MCGEEVDSSDTLCVVIVVFKLVVGNLDADDVVSGTAGCTAIGTRFVTGEVGGGVVGGLGWL